ncbi:MAG: PQQ-binding-like beta-propeller repeat protein, partial [Candidatus Marinimicrobia bacterium]|nr:PQQ-binding-like beta-propeller repeat protein [Candidatus Neomarinimicrobiota bacterium]
LTYISGTIGDVTCLKTSSGDIVWQKNVKSEYDAEKIRWGLTESVLVLDDMVISTPGGKNNMVAFNRFTGEQIWVCNDSDEASAYCSPVLVKHGGTELIVTMTARSIIGVDASTGELYWKFPHKTSYDVNPNTPYYQDGKLYCVSGYGTGGVQLALSDDGKSVSRVWRDKTLDSQMDGFIVHDKYIYGTSHKKPAWHCLDWENGKEMWVDPGIGKGNVIFADGLLYSYAENGTVGLIEPSPNGFNLISSFKVSKGTNQHWAHPVINNGMLYIRHGDTLLAYKVKE